MEPPRPRHNRRAPGCDLRALRISCASRRPDPQLRRRPHRDPPRRRVLSSQRAGERWAGLAVVLAILISACVALAETITRLIHPQQLSHLLALAIAGLIGFAGNEIAAQIRLRAGHRLESPALDRGRQPRPRRRLRLTRRGRQRSLRRRRRTDRRPDHRTPDHPRDPEDHIGFLEHRTTHPRSLGHSRELAVRGTGAREGTVESGG